MNLCLEKLTVKDIMSSNPLRLDEDTSLEEIYRLFNRNKLYCAPVVDRDNRFQGCISVRDLEKSRQLFDLKEYISIIVSGLDEETRQRISDSFSWDGPINLRAREIMSVKTAKVSPSESVQAISQKFAEQRTDHAVVVDESNQVVGVITTFDILNLF